VDPLGLTLVRVELVQREDMRLVARWETDDPKAWCELRHNGTHFMTFTPNKAQQMSAPGLTEDEAIERVQQIMTMADGVFGPHNPRLVTRRVV
jgi:hypothetical protein